jgi:hypothetical protein
MYWIRRKHRNHKKISIHFHPLSVQEEVADMVWQVNVMQELQSPALRYGDGFQSASGEELSALVPSVLLHRDFNGETQIVNL